MTALKDLVFGSGYTREEKETIIIFDEETNDYKIYSNIPRHMRSLSRRHPELTPEQIEIDSEGFCIAMTIRVLKLPPGGVLRRSATTGRLILWPYRRKKLKEIETEDSTRGTSCTKKAEFTKRLNRFGYEQTKKH